MAAEPTFIQQHQGKIALGGASALITGLVCVQVFMLDSDGKGTSNDDEGFIASASKEGSMTTQNAHDDINGIGNSINNFFSDYAKQMHQMDPVAMIVTIAIALAIIAMAAKLLWPPSAKSSTNSVTGFFSTPTASPSQSQRNSKSIN